MKTVKCSSEGNLGILENQLDESHLEIEWLIKEIPHIKSPEALHTAEQQIGEATNRLAARILALKIQESLNKPEIQEEQKTIIKSIQKKFKNACTVKRIICLEISDEYDFLNLDLIEILKAPHFLK